MAIYLDCAATTPVDPRVARLVGHFLNIDYGNAGSRTHEFGLTARRAVERARDQVARAVGCGRGEVLFTSGATESNNLAILGLAEHGRASGKLHLVSSRIEHPSVLEPLLELSRRGFDLTLVPPTPGGWVDADEFARALRPDTLLASIMQVNNETGIAQPVSEIAAAMAHHSAFLHVDAAQGFGKGAGSVDHPRIDLISLSGHKINGPKGIGALVARRRDKVHLPLTPLLFGGGQERGLRSGTLPVHLAAGLGLAIELSVLEQDSRLRAAASFRQRAIAALERLNPTWTGDLTRSVPHILSFSLPGVEAEQAIEALNGIIAVSDGSACSSGQQACSHVLSAMGVDPGRTGGALRFSWCHLTPDPDWDRVIAALSALRAPASGC